MYIYMYVNENGGEMHDRARDKIVCKLRQVSGQGGTPTNQVSVREASGMVRLGELVSCS